MRKLGIWKRAQRLKRGMGDELNKRPVAESGILIDNSRKSTDLHCMHE
jgi:hypothetical protein